MDAALFRSFLRAELERIRSDPDRSTEAARAGRAAQILEAIVTQSEFGEFITEYAYPDLDGTSGGNVT